MPGEMFMDTKNCMILVSCNVYHTSLLSSKADDIAFDL